MQLKKIAAVGLAVVAPFSLSGCLLLPGEFNSEMTVMADGQFAFSYKGQIQLVGLANLLNDTLDAEGANAEFVPACYGALPEPEMSETEKKKDKKRQQAEAKAAADAATVEIALAEIAPKTKVRPPRSHHRIASILTIPKKPPPRLQTQPLRQ